MILVSAVEIVTPFSKPTFNCLHIKDGLHWIYSNNKALLHDMRCNKDDHGITTPSSVNILDLNDDCLLQIFQHLQLVAQVRLASVCPRLRSVFQLCCQLHHKILRRNELNDINPREMKRFFEMAGPYITELVNLPYNECERKPYVNLVQKFCKNVGTIYIAHTKIQIDCLQKLLTNIKPLSTLHLIKCNLDDDSLLYIANLRHLKCLRLEQENKITGRFLSKLDKLEELTFIDCGIQDEYLIEIFKSVPELKKLSLLGCNKLSESSICWMTEHCLQLEELKLFCTSSMECLTLSQLPKLISLELYKENFDSTSCKHFLESLAALRKNQLVCLRIYSSNLCVMQYADILPNFKKLKLLCFDCNRYINNTTMVYISKMENLQTLSLRYCEGITNDAVLMLFSGCPTIKHINLMCCEQLTTQLVFDAIKLLQQQQRLLNKRRNEPVLLLVGGTRIRKSLLTDHFYNRATSLLRLNFSRPSRNARLNMYHTYRIRVVGDLKYFY